MKIPFVYGREFQNTMLALMLQDPTFCDKCCQYIVEDYLFSDTHKWLFTKIKDCFEENNHVPNDVQFEDILKREEKHKRKLHKAFLTKIKSTKVDAASDYIRDQLTEFAKRTAFVDLFHYGQTLYNSGEYDDSYSYVNEQINNLHGISFRDDINVSIEDFETIRKRHVLKHDSGGDKIPTGIPELDKILMGGLSKQEGELGILLGDAKSGKSIALIHMGVAGLTSGKGNVLHFVLEGSTELTLMRYQSRLSGIPFNRLKENALFGDVLTKEELFQLERLSHLWRGRLDLIPFNSHWEYTTHDLENKIVEQKRKNKAPSLAVIDYADLLHPRQSYRDLRHDQREVFRDLKSIGYRHRLAMWSASQVGRPKDNPEKETILRSRHVAEAYEKIRIVDFVGTINRTPAEKIKGLLRFHADIYRSNECDRTFRFINDFSRMIFYSQKYGALTYSELPDWMTKKKKI